MWWAASVLLVAACGRLDFDTQPRDGGADLSVLVDGANDALVTPACPPDALLCEDFESGTLASWPILDEVGTGSTVAIATTRPRRGTFSLEAIKPPTGNSGTAAIGAMIPAPSTGMLAIRAWVYSLDPLSLFNMVMSMSDQLADTYTAVGGDGSGMWVVSEARNGPTMDRSTTTMTSPVNTWVCIELRFTFASPDRFAVLVDEVPVLDATALTPSPAYDYVRFGAVRGDETGLRVFVDDIAVATAPIGCNF